MLNEKQIKDAIDSNKEGCLDKEDAMRFLYPTLNEYIRYVQGQTICDDGRGMVIRDLPKDYITDYANAKSGLFKNIFHDKLVYEKKINFVQDSKDLFNLYDRAGEENNALPMSEIYSSYKKDILSVGASISNIVKNLEKGQIKFPPEVEDNDDLYLDFNYIFDDWVKSDEYHINFGGNDKSSSICLSGTSIFDSSEKKITIRTDGKCGRATYKIIQFLYQIGALPEEEKNRLNVLLDKIGGYYSQLKSAVNLSGTLCISLDPMDFVTCSDNSLGWTSCFAMNGQEGCNYGHSLAMLTAKNVFIAYLKIDDKPYDLLCNDTNDSTLKERYASNKLMRAWVFADDSAITVDKTYPFANAQFNKEIIRLVNEVSNNFYNIDVSDKGYPAYFQLNCAYDDGPFDISAVNSSFGNFPDHHYYYYPDDRMYCFECGGEIGPDEFYDEQGFWCSSCLGWAPCDECGEMVQEDDLYELPDGSSRVCEDCYDAYNERLHEEEDEAAESNCYL